MRASTTAAAGAGTSAVTATVAAGNAANVASRLMCNPLGHAKGPPGAGLGVKPHSMSQCGRVGLGAEPCAPQTPPLTAGTGSGDGRAVPLDGSGGAPERSDGLVAGVWAGGGLGARGTAQPACCVILRKRFDGQLGHSGPDGPLHCPSSDTSATGSVRADTPSPPGPATTRPPGAPLAQNLHSCVFDALKGLHSCVFDRQEGATAWGAPAPPTSWTGRWCRGLPHPHSPANLRAFRAFATTSSW